MHLNNIIKIETANAVDVANSFVLLSRNECTIDPGIRWTALDIKVPASMTIEDEVKDKELFTAVTINFNGCEVNLPKHPYVVKLTLHNGKTMLVGDGYRPHLTGLVKKNHPDNLNDSQLDSVTIKRYSKVGVPYIR